MARAALAIQRSLAELNRKNAGIGKPELKARIGLDAGPAVEDAAGEIYGDVANIAARVQALAEPGAVLVTARVQRQVAGLLVAEERSTHALKGVAEPTALFRLVRASGGGRRSSGRQLTPLVGRDDEMAMLLRRWERARQGDGQLVLIVGEPGLGKSRLIEEFRTKLSRTRRTPGWNGAAHSFCRIPRCTRSPNGAASASNSRPPLDLTMWHRCRDGRCAGAIPPSNRSCAPSPSRDTWKQRRFGCWQNSEVHSERRHRALYKLFGAPQS